MPSLTVKRMRVSGEGFAALGVAINSTPWVKEVGKGWRGFMGNGDTIEAEFIQASPLEFPTLDPDTLAPTKACAVAIKSVEASFEYGAQRVGVLNASGRDLSAVCDEVVLAIGASHAVEFAQYDTDLYKLYKDALQRDFSLTALRIANAGGPAGTIATANFKIVDGERAIEALNKAQYSLGAITLRRIANGDESLTITSRGVLRYSESLNFATVEQVLGMLNGYERKAE